MIYLLATLLLLLLVLCYFLNKKELIAPSFVFVASFVFSIFWAIAFYDEWKLNTFHYNTFFVIFGGCTIFFVTTFIVSKIMNLFKKKDISTNFEYIYISPFIKITILLFMIFSSFIILKSVITAVGYSWDNIFEAIERFDYISKFSNEFIGISKYANCLRYISGAFTYWFLYIIINNAFNNKKIDILSIMIVLIGMASSMTLGGRNYAVNVIISGISILFMILYKSKGFSSKLSKKTKIAIIMIPILIIMVFPKLTNLVGRSFTTSNTYYLAIYCGAEIKNLDMYLENYESNIVPNKNNMTFISINNWLGPKLGYTQPYKYDLPFRSINEYTLGNVYTTFYAYIYDYGYIGIIILVPLMALILQFVYEKAKNTTLTNQPNIWILIYGYMFSSIVFSFFSNKFYEQNFNITFFYNIILWIIFNKFLLKLRVKSTH